MLGNEFEQLQSGELRRLLDPDDPSLSLVRQCELLGISRSGYYYQPMPISPENLVLMRSIDEQYTRTPFYGARRMTVSLIGSLKEFSPDGALMKAINLKRVRRLMREMGIQAIYPGPNTSRRAHAHRIYPYLLRGVKIERTDQVWSSDITFIRLQGGFIFLTAVIDWFSRYVLAWRVSNTLDNSFCLEALESALSSGHGTGHPQRRKPEIVNTDQGSQFTSGSYTARVEAAGAKVSMDGRGRALDNVFVERLWRSVKYEEVYLKEYQSVRLAVEGLANYFRFYNHERPHQSLAYRTPASVYAQATPAAAQSAA